MGRLQLNVPQLQRSSRQIPLEQIVDIQGNNPLATGISSLGDSLSKALEEKRKIKQMAQQTKLLANATGVNIPENTPDSALTDPNLIVHAATIKASQNKSSFDAVGTTSDQKNIIVLNKKTGETELRPIPVGIAPKGTPKQEDGIGSKEEEGWTKLGDHVNNLRQSSRSALGAASIANQRADRALTVLANPNATNQDFNNVLVDLGGIFQGGSPHESSLDAQEYNTLKNKVNSLLTYVTATPQAARQPAVQAKLKEVVSDIKRVDNKIVNNNLGIAAVQFEGLIKKDPARWQRMTNAVNQTTTSPDELRPIQGNPIRVRRKSDGKVGVMPADKFNPDLYEEAQ